MSTCCPLYFHMNNYKAQPCGPIACTRAEELVMQDMLPLGCWVLPDNQLNRQRQSG